MKNKKKHHINTFAAVDGVLLFVLSLICLLPIINVLAISFSSRAAADAGRVALWPVEFTTAAYQYVLDDQAVPQIPFRQRDARFDRSGAQSAAVHSVRLSAVEVR